MAMWCRGVFWSRVFGTYIGLLLFVHDMYLHLCIHVMF